MFSFRMSKQVSDKRALPNGEVPPLALVGVRKSERPKTPPTEATDDDPFHAGIRALFGQLCSCNSRAGGPLRSLGVTSCYRHEGKSTVAAHLAAVAVESRHVVYFDANAPRPLVHHAMQDVARRGIGPVNGAQLKSETLRQPRIVPTAVLPSRGNAGHPTIDETRDLLQALTGEFDLLIVDLPPLDAAGALEWAPLLDGTLLVVEAERVRWQVAARGIALLEQAGGHVLGTVINKRRDYIPPWLYRRL